MSHLLLLMAGLGATHHHQHVSWTLCRSDTGCHRYEMPRATRRPRGDWHACTTSPAITICTTYPTWTRHIAPKPAHRAVLPVKTTTRTTVTAPVGRTELMLVTYYLATGSPMANGIMPSVGWAACGYDLPLGARVIVPGIGQLRCGDRIGFDPWLHIDVYGVELATGYRYVTVLP